jgi:hypothetical protein
LQAGEVEEGQAAAQLADEHAAERNADGGRQGKDFSDVHGKPDD